MQLVYGGPRQGTQVNSACAIPPWVGKMSTKTTAWEKLQVLRNSKHCDQDRCTDLQSVDHDLLLMCTVHVDKRPVSWVCDQPNRPTYDVFLNLFTYLFTYKIRSISPASEQSNTISFGILHLQMFHIRKLTESTLKHLNQRRKNYNLSELNFCIFFLTLVRMHLKGELSVSSLHVGGLGRLHTHHRSTALYPGQSK